MSSASTQPSLDELIQAVRALGNQPELRNLRITRGYYLLSHAFTGVIGGENANWCTFAKWASKTAGRFVRREEIPAAAAAILSKSRRYRNALGTLNKRLTAVHPKAGMPEGSLVDWLSRLVDATARSVGEGNFQVFDELAPVFAAAARQLGGAPEDAALERFLAVLRPGPTNGGGQGLLRSAFTHYYEARCEPDARRQAQRILLANAQIGLHEQMRLQPYIADSLGANVEQGLRELVHQHHAGRFPSAVRQMLVPIVDALLHPVLEAMNEAWLEFATRFLMELRLPEGTLRLGTDLPAPPGAPLFPPALQTIDDPELLDLLQQYGADSSTTRHSGASNWARLPERMRYILELFRSRQQDRRLFEYAFDEDQRPLIDQGQVPGGKL